MKLVPEICVLNRQRISLLRMAASGRSEPSPAAKSGHSNATKTSSSTVSLSELGRLWRKPRRQQRNEINEHLRVLDVLALFNIGERRHGNPTTVMVASDH